MHNPLKIIIYMYILKVNTECNTHLQSKIFLFCRYFKTADSNEPDDSITTKIIVSIHSAFVM